MGSRTFNTIVVVFWMATMSWLVVEKVLPPLRVGDPPNYRSILNQPSPQPPVCWAIYWNRQPLGWAATQVKRRDDGMSELQSRVFFGKVPLDEIAPGWMGAFVKPVMRQAGRMDMEARSTVEIDPLGRLAGFESRVRMANIRDAIRMRGHMDGNYLRLTVESGDVLLKTKKFLPSEALLGDALSPQGRLPGLRLGQTWTMPVYNPFLPPSSPMEILQATVESNELIVWDGKSVMTKLVVYRADSGSSLLASQQTRGKLWVDQDGVVLKQETNMFNSSLMFVRLSPERSEAFSAELNTNRAAYLSSKRAKLLFSTIKAREP